MDALRQLLTGEDTRPGLDRAALLVARIEFPDLDAAHALDQLNEIASHLGDRLRNFNDGRDFVETAQRYLFGEMGFHGNEEDYYDPRNSCLNQVLERRIGIPITLAVLYMEVARRLQMPVYGIGLPRRFVLQFDDGRYATFIDPYGGGRAVSAGECFALAGATVADPELLRRASRKDIVMRMLRNLQECYLRRNDFLRAVAVLDLLLEGAPGDPSLHKLRGVLSLELREYQNARRHLERYLALTPDASDRETILKQIELIHRWLAQVN